MRKSPPRAAAPAGRSARVDCQIAAIALARGFAVATRNVPDFADMGIEIADPWAGV